MIVTNGLVDLINGKVNLPITMDGVTRICEVRVANNLDTELILGLEGQGKFAMAFLSLSKKVLHAEFLG